MVRTLKDAIILSQLREPRTSEEIAISMRIEKSNITRSLSTMKRTGLVRGHGRYIITSKGKTHFNNVFKKINGR